MPNPPSAAVRRSGKRSARSEAVARRCCQGNAALPASEAKGDSKRVGNPYEPALAVHFVSGSVKKVYDVVAAARRSG